MLFNSQIDFRGNFNADWTDEIIKNEPMFFNCDLDFAYANGGPITREFIENLPRDWLNGNPVLDSRVHMLMKNWYPCIPGWHHDDVPRSTRTGQPNYLNPEYHSDHLMGLVNGHICPTQFAIGQVEVSDPDPTKLQYNVWDTDIKAELELMATGYKRHDDAAFMVYEAESGRYIQFDCNAFHTGVKAVAGGWRWFIRLSRNTSRQKTITNEIRRQVQVYLDEPMAGW